MMQRPTDLGQAVSERSHQLLGRAQGRCGWQGRHRNCLVPASFLTGW
jgi:hypothetical protein